MNDKFPQTHPHQKTGGLFNVYCVYIIIMYVYVYNMYVHVNVNWHMIMCLSFLLESSVVDE